METNNNQSFWQFSDQLRASNLANLSLNDSIWSNNYVSKRPTNERKNFDIRVGGELTNNISSNSYSHNYNNNSSVSVSSLIENSNGGFNVKPTKGSDYNLFDDGYNKFDSLPTTPNINDIGLSPIGQPLMNFPVQKNIAINTINGGFNKGVYSKPGNFVLNNDFNNRYMNVSFKGINKGKEEEISNHGGKNGKKNGGHHKKNHNNNNNVKDSDNSSENNKSGVEKRFKTLPPSEALPRNETIGGYIFVCNNDTMAENLKRQLFGMFKI